jgi:small-conductance mechanosensitive channel
MQYLTNERMQFFAILMQFFAILKPLGVLIFGIVAVYLVNALVFKKLKQRYPDTLPVHVFVRLCLYLLYFLVAVCTLQEFGINMTALIGAAGIFGIAIGFAAQTSMANIISGLFLTLERPFNLNDTIVVDGIEGSVKALDLFAVTVCTSDNKMVRISNEKVLKSTIVNMSKRDMRRFDVTLDFEPETNIQHACDLLHMVIKASDYLAHDREPYIVVSHITGSYIRVHIGVWTSQQKWHITRLQFLPHLKYVYDQQGIKLAVTSSVRLAKN